MKVKNFSTFINSRKTNENSDLDWSDKNWDESGVDGTNPPNSGLEGTSAEPMDYTAGDYGETSDKDDESASNNEDTKSKSITTSNLTIDNIKAMIDDITERVNKISPIK